MIGDHRRPDLPDTPSDHFDGRRFFNPGVVARKRRRGDLLRWLAARESTPWPRTTTFSPPPAPPAHSDTLRITWINHATVLVQAGGHNLIADPVYADAVSPLGRYGPRRSHPPGVAFDALPRVDTVLISHAHYDHLDHPTVKRLIARDDPAFVAGLGLARWLERAGARRIQTLDWWQQYAIGHDLTVIATPARHWSRRGAFDRNRSLWLGYWIETPAGSAYFAGDTGMGDHFETIRARLGAPRVALLPIGAYEPRWFMAAQHMNPADAVEAHRVLGAESSIGIHFATFKLTNEGQFAPVADLARAREAVGISAEAFVAPNFGEGFTFE